MRTSAQAVLVTLFAGLLAFWGVCLTVWVSYFLNLSVVSTVVTKCLVFLLVATGFILEFTGCLLSVCLYSALCSYFCLVFLLGGFVRTSSVVGGLLPGSRATRVGSCAIHFDSVRVVVTL